MTKQQQAYVRRVTETLPRRFRPEVRRDLEEAFAEAAARGEPAEAVLARLGPAAEYAAALREQLGVRPVPVWVPAALLLAAAGLLGLFAYRVAMAPPPDAIGYAVSVTSIQLTGSGLPSWCLPVLAAVAVVTAVLLWRRCRR